MRNFKYVLMSFILILAIIVSSEIFVNNEVVNASTNIELDGMSAQSYVVMDSNGRVLYQNNKDEKREVASICKLMTTLLVLEEIDKGNLTLDNKLVASSYACSAEGSQAFLDAGSEYKVSDLLKSVIIASANDSAIVLAEGIGGTENNFVTLMNNKAKELGMNNTLYANSTGLPANKQYSTANDTAIILNKISAYPEYRKDCSIWMDKLVHPSGRETELVNTNRLIKYYPNCQTGKTGFTDEAGYCLSSTAVKDNLKLTCVVLGCSSSADRFTDSVTLYNLAYANYTSKEVLTKGVIVENAIKVNNGKSNTADLIIGDSYYLTMERNSQDDYSIKYELPEVIKAPMFKGDKVGNALIVVDGEIIKEVDIVLNIDLEKQTYLDIVNKIVDKFNFIN